jgi:hypothetical protein
VPIFFGRVGVSVCFLVDCVPILCNFFAAFSRSGRAFLVMSSCGRMVRPRLE